MDFNCTPPAVGEFPKDIFSKTHLQNGAIIIHILFTIYLFTAIAIICDEYFVPVVEKLCHIFHLPPDIAGATLMATATSSPELFVNIVGTFVTEGDIGLGTIVGSAVFNILAVPSCCGLTLAMTGTSLKLDWWPLTRDSFVYGVSVCLLIVFLNNERIEWYEAMVLVLVYLAYTVFLFFDKQIQNLVKGSKMLKIREKIIEHNEHNLKTIELTEEIKNDVNSGKEGNEDASEIVDFSLWKWPGKTKVIQQVIWLINWPINFVFFLTVPKCEKIKSNFWIPVAFVMCIFWIGVLSYVLSWLITVIGDTLGIPDSVMGITFLAIGAGVPEAASSIAVVKKGKGAMGISNSLGSNTFDILLCLGVPWLLKSTIVSNKKWVNINSSGLQYSTITLLVTLVTFFLALSINKFQLNKWVGLFTLNMYLLFLIIASLIELNVFFKVNLPTCIN